jgi:hypothetical protein
MPPEFCGGIGAKGASALKEFAEKGGTIIFFNHASDYATEVLGVKAKNVLRGVATKDFYSPGSLLSVTLDLKSPLTLGMPEKITLWSEQSPTWETDCLGCVRSFVGKVIRISSYCLMRWL